MWFWDRPEGDWFIDKRFHVREVRGHTACKRCVKMGVKHGSGPGASMALHFLKGTIMFVRQGPTWADPFYVDTVKDVDSALCSFTLQETPGVFYNEDLAEDIPKVGHPDINQIWVTRSGAPVFYQEMTDAHLEHLAKKVSGETGVGHLAVWNACVFEEKRRARYRDEMRKWSLEGSELRKRLFTPNRTSLDRERDGWVGAAHEYSAKMLKPGEDPQCAHCGLPEYDSSKIHITEGCVFRDPEGQLSMVEDMGGMVSKIKMRNPGPLAKSYLATRAAFPHRYANYDPESMGPDPMTGYRLRPWHHVSDIGLEMLCEEDLFVTPMYVLAAMQYRHIIIRAMTERTWRREKRGDQAVEARVG